MAIGVTKRGRFIEIIPDSTNDWKWSDTADLDDALCALPFWWISSIAFYPGAAGDRVSIRDGASDGALVFYANATSDGDQRVQYFDPPKQISPYFNGDGASSADTELYTKMYATAATNCRIVFELA